MALSARGVQAGRQTLKTRHVNGVEMRRKRPRGFKKEAQGFKKRPRGLKKRPRGFKKEAQGVQEEAQGVQVSEPPGPPSCFSRPVTRKHAIAWPRAGLPLSADTHLHAPNGSYGRMYL
jgi:hypothetical protein